MFKDFLKKYSFVLCASLSSTACFAMDWDIEPYERSAMAHQANEYIDFEFLRRRLQENKEEAHELLAEILNESQEASRHYDKKFMCLYAQPTEELSENDNWLIKLYRGALFTIATKYSELILETTSAFVRKNCFGQATFYNMMGAKAKCPHSYENLCTLINGKTPQYESFLTFLIPFLEEEDVHAQNLFNQVLDDKENASNELQQHMLNLVKTAQGEHDYKILLQAKNNYNKDEGLRLWKKAMELWDKNPKDAVNYLLHAENINDDAKEKLKTLRQLDAYKDQKKAQDDNPARLLKNIDSTSATASYARYLKLIKDISKQKEPLLSTNLKTAAAHLYSAANFGNSGAKTEVKKLKKSKGYKDAQNNKPLSSNDSFYLMAFMYYYFETALHGDNSPSTQEKEVAKPTYHNNSPVNSSPVPSSQEKKVPHKTQAVSSQQEKPESVSHMWEELRILLEEVDKDFPPETEFPSDPVSVSEKKLNETEKKTSVKTPVEKQKSTRRALSRTVSTKAQKPAESAEKPHKEIRPPQTNTNSTPVQKTEEEKEDLKSPESSVVEKTKHHKRRVHREKVDTPNQDHVGSTSREESQELATTPTKKHRQLQRADSVRALPIERPILKRTGSLGKMSVVAEPTPDTNTNTNNKSKTLALKKGVELLLPMKKAAPSVEKKDPSPPQSKKSSSYSKSGVSRSKEKLSKSEESHSRSKKKGSSTKPFVIRDHFFENDTVRKDYIEFSKQFDNLDALLDTIKTDPFGEDDSFGRAELLKGNYKGCRSRHISRKHRIVYSVEPDDRIKILEVGEHYQKS